MIKTQQKHFCGIENKSKTLNNFRVRVGQEPKFQQLRQLTLNQ
jgi:hypothetical protein